MKFNPHLFTSFTNESLELNSTNCISLIIVPKSIFSLQTINKIEQTKNKGKYLTIDVLQRKKLVDEVGFEYLTLISDQCPKRLEIDYSIS